MIGDPVGHVFVHPAEGCAAFDGFDRLPVSVPRVPVQPVAVGPGDLFPGDLNAFRDVCELVERGDARLDGKCLGELPRVVAGSGDGNGERKLYV